MLLIPSRHLKSVFHFSETFDNLSFGGLTGERSGTFRPATSGEIGTLIEAVERSVCCVGASCAAASSLAAAFIASSCAGVLVALFRTAHLVLTLLARLESGLTLPPPRLSFSLSWRPCGVMEHSLG